MHKTKWISDPEHSELSFKIRHLMISNVSGHIRKFRVEAATEGDDFTNSAIIVVANMDSISTDNQQRDEHLKNADFFDVERYPEMRFQSTGMTRAADGTFTLHGDLTIRQTTKPIQLQVEFGGILSDARRGTKAGFTITGKLNRSDWGLSFNRVLETGGLGLGEEVRIFSEIQLQKQSPSHP